MCVYIVSKYTDSYHYYTNYLPFCSGVGDDGTKKVPFFCKEIRGKGFWRDKEVGLFILVASLKERPFKRRGLFPC